MKMVDSALETLGDDVQNTCIDKILAALVRDSGGQKVTPIPKFLNGKTFTHSYFLRSLFDEGLCNRSQV